MNMLPTNVCVSSGCRGVVRVSLNDDDDVGVGVRPWESKDWVMSCPLPKRVGVRSV